jgi:aerobic-type carbon monoxide dehydrogenase small subunit (CoxS/CutS family)
MEGAAQCGICTPGMLVTASTIPAGADAATIRDALAGNLCRCTGYASIVRAVQAAGRVEESEAR